MTKKSAFGTCTRISATLSLMVCTTLSSFRNTSTLRCGSGAWKFLQFLFYILDEFGIRIKMKCLNVYVHRIPILNRETINERAVCERGKVRYEVSPSRLFIQEKEVKFPRPRPAFSRPRKTVFSGSDGSNLPQIRIREPLKNQFVQIKMNPGGRPAVSPFLPGGPA